jgi:hypothetical protein
MGKFNRRVDGNQSEIVKALTACYFSVEDLSAVGGGLTDLLVGGQMRCPHCSTMFAQNKLIEIKNAATGGDLNKRQRRWFDEWRGQRVKVYTAEEALRACGVKV